MRLDNGYDTVIGERGVTLSGGERQRIAIARALLVDPQILVLDDSTSAIDSATEDKIQQRMSKAHKELSFAPEFDYILVNDDLSVACQTAEDLLRKFLNK